MTYPRYVLPEHPDENKCRKRYAQVCARIEGDARGLVTSLYLHLGGLFNVWDAETERHDLDERRKIRTGIQELEQTLAIAEECTGPFTRALRQLGTAEQERQLNNAQLYRHHFRQALTQFRELPLYAGLFGDKDAE